MSTFHEQAHVLLLILDFKQGSSFTTQNWYEKRGEEIRLNDGGFIYIDKFGTTAYPAKIMILKSIIHANFLDR